MEYKAEYKCRHCGQRIENSVVDISKESAIQYLDATMGSQYSNPFLPKFHTYVIHECEDGSVAVADIVGLVKIGNKEGGDAPS